MKNMKNSRKKSPSIVLLMLLVFCFSLCVFSVISHPTAGEDATWYESNENYNIGDFPSNEWNPYYMSDNYIDVVYASSYNVDMSGKVIRINTPGYGQCKGMERLETFTIDTAQSLYLSFKIQANKNIYNSEAEILLVGSSGLTFFRITFDSYWTRIDFEVAGGSLMHYHDLVMNQVYSFDIVFTKDPYTNLMNYQIFINQQLEFTKEVNTNLYPVATYVQLAMTDDGPGEMFLDNFYLGYIINEISTEDVVDLAFPMYYLFAPEYYDDPGDYVESIDLKFRYLEIETQTVTVSVSVGLTAVDVLSVDASIPVAEFIELLTYSKYEVETNEENLIIFTNIVGFARDVTYYLPGVHPETGTSEMNGWYSFDFISEKIRSYTEAIFQSTYGLPDDYDDCKTQAQKVKSMIFLASGGNQKHFQDVDTYLMEYSSSYEIGLGVGIPLGKYFSFDFGISFSFDYSHRIEIDITMGVEWENNPSDGEMVQIDIFAPPAGVYPSSFKLPPYSSTQVGVKVTGLKATGGDRRVILNWDAICGITYYNIYRVTDSNTIVGTSSTTTFTHTGLSYSTTYTYKVSAVVIIGANAYETPLSDPASAKTKRKPSDGGGCPFLSVFNGMEFIEEGLMDIHDSDGIDITFTHELINQPARVDNYYLLRLVEHPMTISHIDKVEFWGVLSNGMMIPLPLISAIHSEDGQVRFLLWFSDDKKVEELGADFNDGISEMIDLWFYAPKWITFTGFVFIIEGNNYIVK